mgnify:CR=1 FL=1
MMLKCRRFYTDQNFRNKVVTYSASLRDIKWGNREKDSERLTSLKPVFSDKSINQNEYNKTFKKVSPSESDENGIKVIKKRREEEQKERGREREIAILNGKREMSYRARRRIILRIRGENEENENDKNNFNEANKNEEKKIKEIEIKLPLDKIKIKRWNKNHSFNNNSENETMNTNGDNDIVSRTNKYIWTNFNIGINKNNNSSINSSDGISRKRFLFYKGRNKNENENKIDNELNNNKTTLNKDKILNKEKSKLLKINNSNGPKGLDSNNNNTKNKFKFKKKKKEKININIDSFSHYKITTNNNIFFKILKNKRKGNICLNKNNKTNNEINDNQYFHFKEKKIFYRRNSGSNRKDDYEQTENTLEDSNKFFNPVASTKNINDNNMNLKRNNHYLFFNYLANKRQANKISSLNRNSTSNKMIPFQIELFDKYNNRTFKLDNHKSDENKTNRLLNISNSNKINLHTVFSMNSFNSEKHNSNSEKIENKTNIIFTKKKFMIYFFEDLIEISYALQSKNLFSTLICNFNQKFYNINFVNNINNVFNKDNENFEYIYKHYGLILVSLIFLSKDDNLYSSNLSLIKELLIQLIYSSLNYAEIDGNKESNKIQKFIKDNNSLTVIPNHRYTLNLIQLIFGNKKEYIELKNVLEQLLNFIVKSNYKELIKVLTESILFCYNSKPKIKFYFPLFKNKNNFLQNTPIDGEEPINSKKNKSFIPKKPPTVPFIKSPMKKDYCLVLDMDETISHTLKLSFGLYFLLRPGAINFLKEVSKYYEIIIFTSSQKGYADNILNKIDNEGNLISHRLYKNHVIFEKGKSVKKLNMIGRDLKKTIFIDNLRSNAKYNINNLCPISNWTGDIYDDKLIKLKNKLIKIATCGKYNDDITQGL